MPLVKQGYRANRNMVFSSKHHVIWCPKYRRPVLRGPVAERLDTIVRQVAAENRSQVIELEVMPDHVHLLAEVDPQFGVQRLAQRIKGRSSRVLRMEFPSLHELPSLWTNSTFVSTVGGAPLAVIKRYIENQKDAA
jgi:putative transposase